MFYVWKNKVSKGYLSFREMVIMNKQELAPGIISYSNVLDGYETMINDIEDAVFMNATSWASAGVKTGEKSGVDKEKRDTESIGIRYTNGAAPDISSPSASFNSSLSYIFFKNFDPIEKDYQNYFGVNLNNHDSYSILKYGKGQKFINHIDDHPDFLRRISTIYYMNDNYTGGEIVFPRFNLKIKPKANEMILFPSTFVYNHSVLDVIEGTRYSVVSWIC